MNDFEIEVEGNIYAGELVNYGYSYKLVFLVDDIPVSFEPDEERNFRAVVATEHMNDVNNKVVLAIAEELQTLLK